MRVFRKFRASDGRIKIATLSGVSALVAVIALLVGVLPVFAADGSESADEGVHPVVVDWGGGSGACEDVLTPVDGGDDRGPSAATYELHINNPTDGFFTDPIGGGRVELTVGENDQLLDFQFVDQNGDPVFVGDPGTMVAHDVVVNGGSKSTHYDYDAVGDPVTTDSELHAPPKGGKGEYFNLSHVNICYDVAPVNFVCDDPEKLEGEGLITNVSAVIFANSVEGTYDCPEGESKEAFYFIDSDTVTLDFGADDQPTVAGRLDFTKDFGDPTAADPLKYDRDDTGTFLEVQWCDVRDKDGGDGDQFDEELSMTRYPSLVGVKDTDGKDATACKVFEDLNADGIQHTVVYFEFKDPQFR